MSNKVVVKIKAEFKESILKYCIHNKLEFNEFIKEILWFYIYEENTLLNYYNIREEYFDVTGNIHLGHYFNNSLFKDFNDKSHNNFRSNIREFYRFCSILNYVVDNFNSKGIIAQYVPNGVNIYELRKNNVLLEYLNILFYIKNNGNNINVNILRNLIYIFRSHDDYIRINIKNRLNKIKKSIGVEFDFNSNDFPNYIINTQI